MKDYLFIDKASLTLLSHNEVIMIINVIDQKLNQVKKDYVSKFKKPFTHLFA